LINSHPAEVTQANHMTSPREQVFNGIVKGVQSNDLLDHIDCFNMLKYHNSIAFKELLTAKAKVLQA
jgi:hypothetical protein